MAAVLFIGEACAARAPLAEAIARHDVGAARAAMRAHLVGSAERYRALARLAAAAERDAD